jgi:hypothetical protein
MSSEHHMSLESFIIRSHQSSYANRNKNMPHPSPGYLESPHGSQPFRTATTQWGSSQAAMRVGAKGKHTKTPKFQTRGIKRRSNKVLQPSSSSTCGHALQHSQSTPALRLERRYLLLACHPQLLRTPLRVVKHPLLNRHRFLGICKAS